MCLFTQNRNWKFITFVINWDRWYYKQLLQQLQLLQITTTTTTITIECVTIYWRGHYLLTGSLFTDGVTIYWRGHYLLTGSVFSDCVTLPNTISTTTIITYAYYFTPILSLTNAGRKRAGTRIWRSWNIGHASGSFIIIL